LARLSVSNATRSRGCVVTTPLDLLIIRGSASEGSEVMTLVTEPARLVRTMLSSEVKRVYSAS
jgi:hypothetical protein